VGVKKRPELEKCTRTPTLTLAFVPENLITNKIQSEFELECEEKARIREVHTHTHSHSDLCSRDRVTFSAPKIRHRRRAYKNALTLLRRVGAF
jgi:hypothetical protein